MPGGGEWRSQNQCTPAGARRSRRSMSLLRPPTLPLPPPPLPGEPSTPLALSPLRIVDRHYFVTINPVPLILAMLYPPGSCIAIMVKPSVGTEGFVMGRVWCWCAPCCVHPIQLSMRFFVLLCSCTKQSPTMEVLDPNGTGTKKPTTYYIGQY